MVRLRNSVSVRRRLRAPVDQQGFPDGVAPDRRDLEDLVVGVCTAPLRAEAVDADRVRRYELHVARAAHAATGGKALLAFRQRLQVFDEIALLLIGETEA
jgi:hypothetical protein